MRKMPQAAWRRSIGSQEGGGEAIEEAVSTVHGQMAGLRSGVVVGSRGGLGSQWSRPSDQQMQGWERGGPWGDPALEEVTARPGERAPQMKWPQPAGAFLAQRAMISLLGGAESASVLMLRCARWALRSGRPRRSEPQRVVPPAHTAHASCLPRFSLPSHSVLFPI